MSETQLTWDAFPLRVHWLTFEIRTLTPVRLPPFKGSTFRGAWKEVLTRAYCTASPEERARPGHADTCPACYLTERENDPEARKPYAVRPPLTHETDFPPGAVLTWGITLLGPSWLLLPYVLSAAKNMGRVGIGWQPHPRNGKRRRGRFELQTIYAEHPLRRWPREPIYTLAMPIVVTPQNGAITATDITDEARRWVDALPPRGDLRLHFLTPLRLVEKGRLMRRFVPEAFFRRLLERLFMLAGEFGDPPLEDTRGQLRAAVHGLEPWMAQVRVVEDRTWWWDIQGHSSRLRRSQPLGGLMGEVTLRAPREAWAVLLPPLLWGEVVQVGKNVVKGQGLYTVEVAHPEAEESAVRS